MDNKKRTSQTLSLSSQVFATMRAAFDQILNGTVDAMLDKDIADGSITLKIDMEIVDKIVYTKDGVPLSAKTPQFSYKLQRQMRLMDASADVLDTEGLEILGLGGGQYTLSPMPGAQIKMDFGDDAAGGGDVL